MFKRTQKTLVLLLTAVLLWSMVAGCGSKSNEASSPAVSQNLTATLPESTPEPQNIDGSKQELERVQEIYDVLEGKKEADLLLKNVQIVDVYREKVTPGSLLILNGRIVAVDPDETIVKAKQTEDGKGQYALPGLIDGHFHFESQLVTPTELAVQWYPTVQHPLSQNAVILSAPQGRMPFRPHRHFSRDRINFPTESIHLHQEKRWTMRQ